MAWGLGICQPQGPKFLTRMQYPNITKRNMEDFTEIQADWRLADWFTCQGQENLVEIFEGIFSQFYFSVVYQVRITERNRELLM